MSTLLVRNAAVLVTMDEGRREIGNGGLFIRDGWIEQVGLTDGLPGAADRVLDLTDHVVLPGLINTHHHLYQTLTRALPGVEQAGLFEWLQVLYPIWGRLTPQDVRVSTQVGLAELALSGCTTTSDHLYLFPNQCRLDDQIEAARPIGLRLHASRGSMSLGASRGGLPPDGLVEDEDHILEDTQRVIELYHDRQPGAMTRVAVAPCSPFSVSEELMRRSAELARSLGVRLHTHLAETRDEERFCLERLGLRPLDLVERQGWLGSDVWLAHAVHLDAAETARLARSGTGVAHCPTSNMRLGSGIAPVTRYLSSGVQVGLGVDGSSSNDGSHLLAEARQAMLLARLARSLPLEGPGGSEGGRPPVMPSSLTADHALKRKGRGGGESDEKNGRRAGGDMLSARAALEMATIGGAAVLGREDLGSLEPGKCADLAAISIDHLQYAGAHDPVAAAVLCAPVPVDHLYVHGRPVVSEGRLVTLEVEPLVERHNRAARRLVE